MENIKSFIDEVCECLEAKYSNLQDVEIIVPNNRVKTSIINGFKKIASRTEKTYWLPTITPIKNIFTDNSEYRTAENVVFVYWLYEIYREINGKELTQTFDEFYGLGEIIISDFDEIDKYLIEPERLFQNIIDEKTIDVTFDDQNDPLYEVLKEFWNNVSGDDVSEYKKRMLELWKIIPQLYRRIQEQEQNKKIGTQGFIYRDFVENKLKNYKFESKNYAIVGFSALNECERCLLKEIKAQKGTDNTLFFWDCDKYYINSSGMHQEAGLLLKRNIEEFAPYKNIGIVDNIKNLQEKDIKVIELPSPVAQVKILPEILKEFAGNNENLQETCRNTAIVLGDEKLLLPLRYSIPEDIEYNITMGYPLSYTTSASLVQEIMMCAMRMHSSNQKYYFIKKDLISLINNNIFKFITADKNLIDCITDKVFKSTSEYINYDNIKEEIEQNEFLKSIFNADEIKADFADYMYRICDYVHTGICNEAIFKEETVFISKIKNLILSFKNYLGDGIKFEHKSMYYKLILSLIKRATVAFEGESIYNMQVLGFMETRAIDFKNVIMLSINEKIFPKDSTRQTLIPYKLRKAYQMPSIEYQDSIYAYYFYRLLQRSDKIRILYTSATADATEKSRFVTQINYELGIRNDNPNGRNYCEIRSYDIKLLQQPSCVTVDKTEDIMAQINDIVGKTSEHGISPSAINEYLCCPMKFYLNHIAKIQPAEDIEPNMGAYFGSIFHNTLEILYEDYVGKEIPKDEYEQINSRVDEAVETAIQDYTKSDVDLVKSLNALSTEAIKKYVKKVLNIDKEYAPFTIVSLEKSYDSELDLGNEKIRLKGRIDRVDKKGNTIRVIDYKTGKVARTKYIEDAFDRAPEFKEMIQTLVYCEMYPKTDGVKVSPKIFRMQELNDLQSLDLVAGVPRGKSDVVIDDYMNNYIGGTNIKVVDDFRQNLKQKLGQLINPGVPFVQIDNDDNCKYCNYLSICNRSSKEF